MRLRITPSLLEQAAGRMTQEAARLHALQAELRTAWDSLISDDLDVSLETIESEVLIARRKLLEQTAQLVDQARLLQKIAARFETADQQGAASLARISSQAQRLVVEVNSWAAPSLPVWNLPQARLRASLAAVLPGSQSPGSLQAIVLSNLQAFWQEQGREHD